MLVEVGLDMWQNDQNVDIKRLWMEIIYGDMI